MTDKFDTHSKQALINYRLEKANESLQEAELMTLNGHYNTAISRMYYACYYATVALLLQNNIYASTHSGVKSMFSLHFISTGRLSKELGRTLFSLFEKRNTNDYDDFVYCDAQTIEEFFPKAKEFVKVISDYIEDNNK